MKEQLTLLMVAIVIASLTACSGAVGGDTTSQARTEPSTSINSDYNADDFIVSADDASATAISLQGGSVEIEGTGASVIGTVITVTSAGIYAIQGTLNDGGVIVDTQDTGTVWLLLNGAHITSTTRAPIYVANAGKVVISLAEGTQNSVTDGTTYSYPDENNDPDAAIFSQADLTINGNGALTMNANYKDGIASKKDLKIVSGTLKVNAVNDGVKGKDSVSIRDGLITINAGADGIQAKNTNNPNKGNILIEGGTINITSADDSINANNSITINDGIIQIASGDDGIHADRTLTINDGDINLTGSYEGLESAIITINGGDIHLNASNDGINASGGEEISSINMVYINGGYIFIDADGDGIDTNGSFEMTAGVMLINGPTDNRNGPLDYDEVFNIRGGLLVAVGSSGMAKAPSNTSTQYSVLYNYDAMLAAGTLLHIQSQSGQEILTFMPAKGYQSVVISSPALQKMETYMIYTGGSSTGTVMDGLVEGGVYTPGSQITTFTIFGMVTSIGGTGSGPGGGTP